MLTTIGIDASLTNTGIVVVRSPRYTDIDASHFIERSTIITPKGLKGAERLLYIYEQADLFLPEKADLAVIEDYDYKGQNLTKLGEGQGVLKLLCAGRKIKIISVAPAALKKFATGNSNATKKQMMERYDEPNEHVADAKALALVGRLFLHKKSTIRHELEVIKALTTPKKKSKLAKVKKPFPVRI